MLYIKSVSIDKFKSFKHINLLFNKGFNCVVGPNGSGKSNICDALLFSLGESSLHRLRVNKLEYLINTVPNKKVKGLAKAHVRVQLDGDEKVEIDRGVRSDGKTVYRLNGKRMTRQEVLEVLKKHMVHIDETSTVTQGEINKIIDLNPRQRRELIDLASGIKEFEYKKKESLSELDKVSIKVNEAQVMLTERLGFLKDLEKEKEAAESYMLMSKRLKSLSFNILGKRKKLVESSLDNYGNEISRLETKKKGLDERLDQFTKKVSSLSDERQKITKVLSESSTTLGDTNKKLEGIGSELSALEVKISTGNTSAEEANKAINALKDDIKKAEEKIHGNDSELSALKEKLAGLELKVKKLDSGDSYEEIDTGTKVKEMGSSLRALEAEVFRLQNTLVGLQTTEAALKAQQEALVKELSGVSTEMKADESSVSELKEKSAGLVSKSTKFEKEATSNQLRADELAKRLSSIDSEIISCKEQKAIARSRDSTMQDRLRSAFNKQSGFYGTAAELCSYDGAYAEAIEAAAGSRFNYFVVESMDVADGMIQYLKKQNLGRATFIPVDELAVDGERKEKGLKALVDLLAFDAKFKKVFSYIFSNTYLVDDIAEAKKLGVGERRYVTITGETVEKSGVLSGGSARKVVSLAVLEKRLFELEKGKEELADQTKKANSAVFSSRKEAAGAALEATSLNSSVDEYGKRLKSRKEDKTSLESQLSKLESEVKSTTQKKSAISKDAEQMSQEVAKAKHELQETYEKTLKESVEIAKKGMKKEQVEELERLRNEVGDLKVKSAEMRNENKMLNENKNELSKNLNEKKELIEKTQKGVAADSKKRNELLKEREQIEQEIKSSNKSNREAYERLEVINSDIQKLSGEQGSAGTGSEEISRQIGDVKVRKGQMEVRLNDITAELAAYGTYETESTNEEIEKMEKEVLVLNDKVGALGTVNLKAPEVYEEKSRSVGEANEKVNLLESERRAVLSMIEQIDAKKLNAFISTFNEVNKNFGKLFNYIFPGTAKIELEDMNDPLNTGLEIKMEDGKNFRRLNSLSGGEKSLVSLMLLFAIHMCKPSSVYLFDEIDSALDKENSKKLSQLIKQMSKEAQFVVVSHNDSLIVNADAAIGVVKSEGESKVVGIEISSIMNK